MIFLFVCMRYIFEFDSSWHLISERRRSHTINRNSLWIEKKCKLPILAHMNQTSHWRLSNPTILGYQIIYRAKIHFQPWWQSTQRNRLLLESYQFVRMPLKSIYFINNSPMNKESKMNWRKKKRNDFVLLKIPNKNLKFFFYLNCDAFWYKYYSFK